ncbi:MAG: superoxide dismutase family protein [Pseudobdellovibrionaceae bacterium]
MKKRIILSAILGMFLSSCSHSSRCKHCEMKGEHQDKTAIEKAKAVAVLVPAKGQKVSGTISFLQDGDTTKVTGEIKGLKKNSKHGFHIHEFGDCSAADFTSAGGHFNPEGHPHAGIQDPQRHEGDLGNLQTDATGTAKIDLSVKGMSVQNGIAGRGLIVHEKEDDQKTQPTGNAGGRLACAVIGSSMAR